MITLFENFIGENYKIGDYVLLKHTDDDTSVELECLILKVSRGYCDIEVFDEYGNLIQIDIDFNEIDRKMTPKEIKDYKIKKELRKYNI